MKTSISRFSLPCILTLIACESLQGPVGLNSLINTTSESPGIHCMNGGLKIETGTDDNNNESLEPSEVDHTSYVCHGEPGKPGLNSLITSTSEPSGTNCTAGGYRLDSGVDLNKNNALDPGEITSTNYVCNGIQGIKSLLTITVEPAGQNCQAGGYKVQSGPDNNNNTVLDVAEVNLTRYVCHGKDGDIAVKIPDYTLTVHGKNNCILLNSSVAATTPVSSGLKSVQVTGDAFFGAGASHKKVFLRYSGSDDDHLAVLSIGSTKSLGFRAGKLYAFFADWADINDNSGTASISFGSTNLAVHGKNNCIFLDNSVAAKASIPAGTYKVKVTGNAFFAPSSTHYNVLIRYAGSEDDELDMLAIGGEKILNLRNGYGFYAFFADWDNTNDNSGTIAIEFYKL